MPSKSQNQHNLMKIVAKSSKFAKKVGIPQEVAREFVKADLEAGLWQSTVEDPKPKPKSS